MMKLLGLVSGMGKEGEGEGNVRISSLQLFNVIEQQIEAVVDIERLLISQYSSIQYLRRGLIELESRLLHDVRQCLAIRPLRPHTPRRIQHLHSPVLFSLSRRGGIWAVLRHAVRHAGQERGITRLAFWTRLGHHVAAHVSRVVHGGTW